MVVKPKTSVVIPTQEEGDASPPGGSAHVEGKGRVIVGKRGRERGMWG